MRREVATIQSDSVANDDAITDRLAALRALSPQDVSKTLQVTPHAAGMLVGVGTLHHLLSPAARGLSVVGPAGSQAVRPPDLKRIALALGHSASIRLTLELLEPAALQLAIVLASFGGSLGPDDLARELAPIDASKRDELVESLVVRLVAERRAGTVVLRPGVGEFLRPPGRPLDRLLLDQQVTSDEIARQLRRLGVPAIPSRKSQRIAALRDVVGSIESLTLVVSDMRPTTRDAFESLLARGPRGGALGEIGASSWHIRTHSPVPAGHPVAPLRDLYDLGLVWLDESLQQVGLWLEIHAAVRGRLFEHWPEADRVGTSPIDDQTAQLPPVLTGLENLLRLATLEPLPGLKTAGIGVRVTRDLAKRLGLAVPRVALMLDLAQGLGLIEEVGNWARSGRTGSWQYSYRTQPTASLEWSLLDPIAQWAALVSGWIDGRGTPGEGATSLAVRRQVVADLLALEPGHGIAAADFVTWFVQRHASARHDTVTTLLDEVRALDLVPASGPVGLSTLARALVAEPASAEALLPELTDRFVVQSDLTIVAPLALAPALRARLDRLCSVESDSTVVVYRLDPVRIATELAAGENSASLIDFLTRSSSVPLATSVGQMILDAERRRGGLTIASASTVVTADDVLGLAEAVKVKAARLTLVAPTVAVSDLPMAKVLAALRAKGLAPTGSAAAADAGDDEVVSNPWRAVPRPSNVTVIHPSFEHIEEVVAHATT